MSEAEHFSILVDETKVRKYYHNGKINEFLELQGHGWSGCCFVTDTIIEQLSGFDLGYRLNLVGQGYDGATVMSEVLSDVAKQIQNVAPPVFCVHC